MDSVLDSFARIIVVVIIATLARLVEHRDSTHSRKGSVLSLLCACLGFRVPKSERPRDRRCGLGSGRGRSSAGRPNSRRHWTHDHLASLSWASSLDIRAGSSGLGGQAVSSHVIPMTEGLCACIRVLQRNRTNRMHIMCVNIIIIYTRIYIYIYIYILRKWIM